MKKHFLIKYILTGFSQLWLLISILYCIQLGYFLISGKDGYFLKTKTSAWGSPNIYRDGYPIPVKLSIKMPPDTIVKWKHENTGGDMHLSKNQLFRYDKADSILNDPSIAKEFYFSKWILETGSAKDEITAVDNIVNPNKRDLVATVESNYFYDTNIKLKSNSKFRNIAFAFYSLISALAMLLIAFNVFRLFHYVRNGNNFLGPLYKKIFNIGIILISTGLIKFLLSLLYARWYGAVIQEKISSIPNLGGYDFNVQFNPAIDFSLTQFLFGLSLIVLASLFKYGNQLEKENALTI